MWNDEKEREYCIFEVTFKCIQARFLLRPSEKTKVIILGILAKAQEMYDFELFGYAVLSNHLSYLIGGRSVEHVSAVMEYIHGNISTELGRKEYSDWEGTLWSRRGLPIPVLSDEDADQRPPRRYAFLNDFNDIQRVAS